MALTHNVQKSVILPLAQPRLVQYWDAPARPDNVKRLLKRFEFDDDGGVASLTRRIRRVAKLDSNIVTRQTIARIANQTLRQDIDGPAASSLLQLMLKHRKNSDLFMARELCAVAGGKQSTWSLRQLASITSLASKLGLMREAEHLLRLVHTHLSDGNIQCIDPTALGFLCETSWRLGLRSDGFLR